MMVIAAAQRAHRSPRPASLGARAFGWPMARAGAAAVARIASPPALAVLLLPAVVVAAAVSGQDAAQRVGVAVIGGGASGTYVQSAAKHLPSRKGDAWSCATDCHMLSLTH